MLFNNFELGFVSCSLKNPNPDSVICRVKFEGWQDQEEVRPCGPQLLSEDSKELLKGLND